MWNGRTDLADKLIFSGMDIMRIENGRVAEYWVSSDGLYLMAQLGAL
jgi:predicted ester cyclase